MFCVILLVSCFSTAADVPDTAPDRPIIEPDGNENEGTPQPEIPAAENIPTPPKAPENSIFYVKYGSAYLPISYVQEGSQVLTGDGGWFFELEEKFRNMNAPKPEDLSKISSFDMYESGSQLPPDDWAWLLEDTAVSDKSWNFFPPKLPTKNTH